MKKTELIQLIEHTVKRVLSEGKLETTYSIKPYMANMFNDSEDNNLYYVDYAKQFIKNPKIFKEKDKYGLSSLVNRLGTISSIDTEEKFNSIPEVDQINLIKKLYQYCVKDANAARQYSRKYAREDKEKELAYKRLEKMKNLDVTYSGDANEKMLGEVIRTLRLYKYIKPHAKIEIFASTYKESRTGKEMRGGDIDLWTILAKGWITIDGKEWDFDEIYVNSGGYDPYYYDA